MQVSLNIVHSVLNPKMSLAVMCNAMRKNVSQTVLRFHELIHLGNSVILLGSAEAMLTNILSFSLNVAGLTLSYFVMDDDMTNYFENEHFEFLLRDTFLQIVHH